MAKNKNRQTRQLEKMAKTSDEGEVYYIKTDRGLFPLDVLKAEETKTKSTQAEEDRFYRHHGLVSHPFETAGLLWMQDNCPSFDACVRQIAVDVVGQGYKLTAEEGKENEDEKEKIENFLNDPNSDPEETIENIVDKAMIDWGVIGWFGLEMSRDNAGIINGLWHVSAQSFHIHEKRKKFMQQKGQQKMWFKAYGSEENISKLTGDVIKGPRNLANELIYNRRYYPRNDYYGSPSILPAVGSVKGLIGVRDFNLSFFENYGIPAALVIITGKWKAEAAKQISDFIDVEIKRTDNAHKTMILRPAKGCDVKIERLSVDVKEGSFNLYHKMLREDVLMVHKMPPYRIGIPEVGSLGGSTATESTRIYVSSVINPLKNMMASLITKTIIRDGMDNEIYTFEFNPIDLREKDADVKRYQMLFGMASITPNQIREAEGEEGYGDAGDQYYVASNYLPIGEESVDKRESGLIASLESLKARVDEAIEKKLKVLPPGTDEEGLHG